VSKIDERIVEMSFENSKFESGISQSSKSLAEFNSALEKSGSSSGLSHLGGAVDTVHAKFTAFAAMAAGALAEIGAQAVHLGESLITALAITPVTDGFNEYELKLNAIRTILASAHTKEGLPVTLEMVNEQLELLNEYSDQTIYSFSDMTQNIGKFTNAGVDLETAVQAIKGIANAAALSGSNANEASRAMYNFAQALSAGYVKLIDWKSIETANMATVAFKEALLEAAVEAGTLEKAADGMYKVLSTNNMGKTMDGTISATRYFNDSLQYQWMTTEALTTALQWYSDETTEIGQKATEAATKIRTFSQLIDTTKEALGSGWATSFEAIFGDFDQATEMWTRFGNEIDAVVKASSKARNDILYDWQDLGGRTAIIEGIIAAWEGLKSILGPIREAFANVFPPVTGEMLADISKKFQELMEGLKIGPTTANMIRTAFEGLFTIIKAGADVVIFGASAFFKLLDALSPIGEAILKGASLVGEGIKIIADAINGVTIDLTSFKESLKETFQPLMDTIQPAIDWLYTKLKELRDVIGEAWRTEGFAGFLALLNGLLHGGIAVGFIEFVENLVEISGSAGGLIEGISGIFSGLRSSLETFQNTLKAKVLIEIAAALAILTVSIVALSMVDADKLRNATVAMAALATELSISFGLLQKTLAGTKLKLIGLELIEFAASLAILADALADIANIPADRLADSILALSVMLGSMIGVAKLLSGTKGFQAAAISLIEMGVAINLIVVAMKPLSELNVEQLNNGLLTIGSIATGMLVFTAVMAKIGNGASLIAAGAGLILVATACVEMSVAINMLGNISWPNLVTGIIGLGTGLIVIVDMAIKLTTSANPAALLAASAALVIMGAAILEMATTLMLLGGMSLDSLVKSLGAFAAGMLVMTEALIRTSNPAVLAGAAAMLVMAASSLVLATAMGTMALISWEGIAKGLVTLALAFVEMGVAAIVLSSLIGPILALAAALALFGVAALAVGAGINLLGTGLISLSAGGVAAIGMLVVAISEIAALIPEVLYKIAEGIVAMAYVITAGAPAIAEAIVAVIVSCVQIMQGELPLFTETLLSFLTDLLTQLAARAPELVAAAFLLIDAFLEGLAANMQQITEYGIAMVVELLAGIAEKIPDMGKAGTDIVVSFLQTIAEQAPRIVDAGLKMIISFINGMADAIRENTPLLIDALLNLCTAFMDGILDYFGISGSTSTESESWGKAILDGLISAITNHSLVLDALKVLGAAMIDAFCKLFGINSPSTVAEGWGKDVIAGLIQGLDGKVSDLLAKVQEFVQKMITTVTEKYGEFKTTAGEVMSNFIQGITGKVEEVYQSVRSFVAQCVSEIGQKYESFKSAGANLVQGFIEGIGSWISRAATKAAELAKSALSAAEAALGEKSPSKEFARIGAYCSIGMANGISEYAGTVEDATTEMAKSSLNVMSDTMSKLSDEMSNIDATPTITPVLDLSNVKSGVNTLSGMLDSTQSYALAQSISRQSELGSSIQNGSNLSGNGETTIVNKFDMTGLTIRSEADIDEIARKLLLKQQSAMRGRGVRSVSSYI